MKNFECDSFRLSSTLSCIRYEKKKKKKKKKKIKIKVLN